MNLTHFKKYNKQDILSLTRLRRFETKLGERVQVLATHADMAEAINQTDAKFIILGIPEDIGVRANLGVGGSSTGWLSFLQSFLNIQSSDFISGENVSVIGHFDFGDMQYLIDKNAYTDDEKIEAYRHAVIAIDEEVESLIKLIVAAGKFPIVIGGGHNNAYPVIKGTAKGLQQSHKIDLAQINCINLDAHTDYRPAEGRHSGNGFRYAEDDGYLQKYCVIGVHENYIPQNVWVDIVNNPFIDLITYEDIFVHQKRTFRQAVTHAVDFTSDHYTGVEIDLDVVENVLSSSCTPSGIQVMHARQFVNLCAAHVKACYLHICEGAVRLENGTTNELTGKLITYLVADFVKMHESIADVQPRLA